MRKSRVGHGQLKSSPKAPKLKSLANTPQPKSTAAAILENDADLKAPAVRIDRLTFTGISLGGGKSDKTCVAHVEYFTDKKKIFLSEINDKLKAEGDISADLLLHEELTNKNLQAKNGLQCVAYNVPLTLPKCMTCQLQCPGYESCDVSEIQWMWSHYRELEGRGNAKKLFTPYTERCVEQYLATELEEVFHVQQALGANCAPLTARAQFLNRRLAMKTIEVHPRLSLWRIGRALHVQKSYLRFHKHQAGGDEARQVFLRELIQRAGVFIYEQDVRMMVQNANAFDAFLCALTAVLKHTGQCEPRPSDFPSGEGWIEIPREDIVW